jgi:glycosyltransferase involved in cell wall biosynthesis
LKIAIIHDWLVTYAGAERVLEQILLLYPDSDVFTVVDFLPDNERTFLQNKHTNTSFIQRLPFAKSKYRQYLFLMPHAVERLDISSYDLVLSSSHAVAKGIRTHSNQLHICYCHTPVRYAWDLQDQYLRESGLDRGIKGVFARLILKYIRKWDLKTSQRVNYFIANSKYIAERIKRIYERDSAVIYPPVSVEKFEICTKKEDFYITVSRMVPYKKIDLIVETFTVMSDKKLIVIGDGPDFAKIETKAGRNIELLGHQPFEVVRDYMRRARAFVFAAEEDFGIAPVEAQACGKPVIAYGRGGALETVLENKTGIFFKEQTVESLIEAVNVFEKDEDRFDCNEIRKNAERFSKERFKREFREFVEKAMAVK